jgi:transposase
VTQIRLFGGRCVCCGERVTAQAPAGLQQGSPFGHSIAAMVVYLHYAHAIGMERLALLMGELFSLSISEGAICNILARHGNRCWTQRQRSRKSCSPAR